MTVFLKARQKIWSEKMFRKLSKPMNWGVVTPSQFCKLMYSANSTGKSRKTITPIKFGRMKRYAGQYFRTERRHVPLCWTEASARGDSKPMPFPSHVTGERHMI